MTQIKICGLTRGEDVRMAVQLGVNALGFILAESPRQVSLEQVSELENGLPPFLSTVAVVMDPEEQLLDQIVSSGLFSHIQFHGKEDPSMLKELGLKTIKTFSIETETDLYDLERYQVADFFLFDARVGKQRGGTGKTFNWDLLKKFSAAKPFILAGGLGSDNITQAIRICNPVAVDLNSRVESEPGKKDPDLLKRAVIKIRELESTTVRSEMK